MCVCMVSLCMVTEVEKQREREREREFSWESHRPSLLLSLCDLKFGGSAFDL